MLPSISVITPSYNQGQYIGQTVESVLAQGYPNLNYIVIDGGSTDDTLAVLSAYTSRLTLLSEPDNGQTDALNKGLKMATGEVICWLNSDDYFLPGTLLTVGRFFEQHPDKLWLTGDCLIVDTAGQPIQQPIRAYKRLLRQLSPAFYLGMTNAICQPSTFWRRSAHEQLGFLDESLRYTMDYDWWLRLLALQRPARSSDTFTAFRIHETSKGGSQFLAQFAEDYAVCSRYWPTAVRGLHKLHNRAIMEAYGILKA